MSLNFNYLSVQKICLYWTLVILSFLRFVSSRHLLKHVAMRWLEYFDYIFVYPAFKKSRSSYWEVTCLMSFTVECKPENLPRPSVWGFGLSLCLLFCWTVNSVRCQAEVWGIVCTWEGRVKKKGESGLGSRSAEETFWFSQASHQTKKN